MCKVFCKSIRIIFPDINYSNSNATAWPEANQIRLAQIVFIFVTILYQLKTQMLPSRIEHK
ncbi:MAG: hypothetical protein DMF24_12055 [Verrucomicrobia bacterium]|nr:MAG: hypothetical protein DMF24_12055 [Verrucomicrobiota bacterium]